MTVKNLNVSVIKEKMMKHYFISAFILTAKFLRAKREEIHLIKLESIVHRNVYCGHKGFPVE